MQHVGDPHAGESVKDSTLLASAFKFMRRLLLIAEICTSARQWCLSNCFTLAFQLSVSPTIDYAKREFEMRRIGLAG